MPPCHAHPLRWQQVSIDREHPFLVAESDLKQHHSAPSASTFYLPLDLYVWQLGQRHQHPRSRGNEVRSGGNLSPGSRTSTTRGDLRELGGEINKTCSA